ncbi:MAG: NUDIX domain-containing protein [Rhodospirillaceae bacterium]|nr:NUDIX domain-containing protein [Rhodospirillaceae bacterium]
MTALGASDIEVLEKTTAFQGYFRIDRYTLRHARFDGGWTKPMTREVFERGHAAAVLPYDPSLGQFVLCQQFRIGAYAGHMPAWQVELVAGIIEDGESAEQVVIREGMEEAGLAITELIPISHYLVSPGGTTETLALYLGRVSASNAGGIFGLDSENEHIRVFTVDERELRRMLDSGEMTNAQILIASQWFFLNREHVISKWK